MGSVKMTRMHLQDMFHDWRRLVEDGAAVYDEWMRSRIILLTEVVEDLGRKQRQQSRRSVNNISSRSGLKGRLGGLQSMGMWSSCREQNGLKTYKASISF